MPTCPNGHQSAADDWCEVCGHRMADSTSAPAGAVPPSPSPPVPGGGYGYPGPSAGPGGQGGPGGGPVPPGPPPQGYGYPGPGSGGPGGPAPGGPGSPGGPAPGGPAPSAPGGPGPQSQGETCPQCGKPREGQAPFCDNCRYNFLTNSPMTYVPADQSPQPDEFSRPGVQNGPGPQGRPGPPPPPPGQQGQQGPPPPPPPGQQGQHGPPPPPPFPSTPSAGQDQRYDFESGDRPSEVNRPAEPLTSEQPPPGFGGFPGQGPGQGPGGPGQGLGQQPGQGFDQGPGQGFGQEPGQAPGQGPGQGLGPGPGGPGHSQGQGGPMAPPPPGGSQQPSPPSGDWSISPPGAPQQEQQQPPGAPPFPGQGPGQGPPPGAPQQPQHQYPQQPGAGGHDQGQQMQPAGPPGSWVAVIAPDREYFAAMMDRSGPEASNLNLPAYSPEQQLPLTGNQITIGRRRHSTGEAPDIDLARTPEDPGVSHQHAVLVQQPDGSWSVVDQDSTNGTTINGAEDPIQPFVPVPLKSGDRVHVGAWTTITLHLT